MIEVTLDNIKLSAETWGAALLLPLEQVRSGFEYLFVDLLPALGSWFADNFTNLMQDIGTVFKGVFLNMGDVARGVWEYIISGFSVQEYAELMIEVGRAGAEGFLQGIEPMSNAFVAPTLRISEFEKALESMLDGGTTSLLSDFDTKFNERIAAMNGKGKKPLDVDVNLNTKGSSLSGLKSDVNVLQSTESRLLVRGATDDPLLKISQQQYQVLQDILNATVRREQITFEAVN